MLKSLSFESLYSASQVTKDDMLEIFELAKIYKNSFINNKKNYSKHSGKIVGTLFFEPSTRTRLSFESAAIRLGASIIGAESMQSTSIAKSESIEDTARIISNYCDIAIIRHPQPYSCETFAKFATIPVVNAGDGSNEHPTQALLDVFTIFEEFNKLSNLNIIFAGDIKHSRTIPSLIKLISKVGDNHFYFIAEEFFQIEDTKLNEITKINNKNSFSKIVLNSKNFNNPLQEINYFYERNFSSEDYQNIKSADVIYITRPQKERYTIENYASNKVFSEIIINEQSINIFKDDAIIMHPLPRVNEISTKVDSNKKAKYFQQAENGLFIRMSLLDILMSKI